MAKQRTKTVFFCDSCGNETLRWEGRCPSCGEWNSLVEAPREGRKQRRQSWLCSSVSLAEELSQVSTEDYPRLRLSSAEIDRVLGGGIVPGSLTLLAGDPGIGKSTLLLRVAADVASRTGETLYVSGEESTVQVRMRADRLGLSGEGVYMLQATSLDDIIGHLEARKPVLAIIDSIQTVYDDAVSSEPGSIAQIRECTRRLLAWAKATGRPLILSGHVTKGGDVAGPRLLEHMVDVVLYMEGDPISAWRLMRAVKNRFGSTNEVGVFEMTERGLVEVDDPSKAFLSGRMEGSVGSIIVSTVEGSRPLLVEIQALTAPSVLPTPRRVCTGLDFSRLLLICAVLTRRVGIPLSNQDVVVNVTGGLRVTEPAADLGVALALASSFYDAPVAPGLAAVGEVGLSGEVRAVPHLERRLRELSRVGLARCLAPDNGLVNVKYKDVLETVPVSSLVEAVEVVIPRKGRKSNRGHAKLDAAL